MVVAVCSDIVQVVLTDIRSGAQREVKVDVGQSFILGLPWVRCNRHGLGRFATRYDDNLPLAPYYDKS